ncbi:MAG: hypothetical protein ACREEL_05710 [Stellaceae bacterium]
MRRGLVIAALLASTALLTAPAMAAGWKFEKIATIQMPGPKGHNDIVTYDPSNGMLYASMPDDGLCIVNTHTNTVVQCVHNIPSPNGNAFDRHYVYVNAGEGAGAGKVNAIVVISKKTWKEVGRVTTKGTSPDGIQVDAATNTVYIQSDDNNWVEKYKSGAHLVFEAKWPLYPPNPKAGPDVGTLVTSLHALYVPDDSWFEKLDTRTGQIVAKVDSGVKLMKHGGTKASIYDPKTGLVWGGTTNGNAGMIVYQAKDLKIVKKLPTHGGIDAVSYDPKLGLAYAWGGGGRKGFDVFDMKTMTPVAFISNQFANTHAGDVDTANHDVYTYAGDGGVIYVYKPVRE